MTVPPITGRRQSSRWPSTRWLITRRLSTCWLSTRALRTRGLSPWLVRKVPRVAAEQGAATAEYAIATMAAVGFAGLLVVIMRSDEVRGILLDLVRNALTVPL